MKQIKPFLICDDSEFNNILQLKDLLPKGDRLIEPFAGAGSVFLNTDYPAYLLADPNKHIINIFEMLASGKEFIERAKEYFRPITNTKEVYEFYQFIFNEMYLNKAISENRIRMACLFLYLNHHGVRTQCYYHGKNGFNVPYGGYKEVVFPEQEMLAFLDKIKRCDVVFLSMDFKNTLAKACEGDVVYCDLPYMAADKDSYYCGGRRDFTWGDQFRLFNILCNLELRNIPVMVSNNNITRKVLAENFTTAKYWLI